MENASQAMIIVAGVLIGVMILTLGAALFIDLTTYVQSSQETIKFNELNSFNAQFLKYVDVDVEVEGTEKKYLTIHDVVTAANLANQNNISYDALEDSRGNPSSMYVTVYLGTNPIEAEIQEKSVNLLGENITTKYECTRVEISNVTGRVYLIQFKEI